MKKDSVPVPPSSHTPLLAVAHVLSLTISRVFSRKPHASHQATAVGRYEPLPPCGIASPSARPVHVFWHSVKGMYGALAAARVDPCAARSAALRAR